MKMLVVTSRRHTHPIDWEYCCTVSDECCERIPPTDWYYCCLHEECCKTTLDECCTDKHNLHYHFRGPFGVSPSPP